MGNALDAFLAAHPRPWRWKRLGKSALNLTAANGVIVVSGRRGYDVAPELRGLLEVAPELLRAASAAASVFNELVAEGEAGFQEIVAAFDGLQEAIAVARGGAGVPA